VGKSVKERKVPGFESLNESAFLFFSVPFLLRVERVNQQTIGVVFLGGLSDKKLTTMAARVMPATGKPP